MRDGDIYPFDPKCEYGRCGHFDWGGVLCNDYVAYGLCASAVPLFFLISGFLYFTGCESQFGLKDYMAKNRKRLRTLLIPYLLWNIFTLLLFGAVQTLMPHMMSGKHTLIV